MADKNKDNKLDIKEVKEFFEKLPKKFKTNDSLRNALDKIEKKSRKLQYLTKEEFIDILEEIDSHLVEEEDLENVSLIDSVIVSDNQQFNDLEKLCHFEGQKWNLIYRASRDGFKANDFHEKCDGIPNTLAIIKTTNGQIFGGFSSLSWNSEMKEYEQDSSAYIFSLVNNINTPKLIECESCFSSIKCDMKYGPCFGSGDLVIADNSNSNSESSSKLGNSYGSSLFESESNSAKTFLAGSENFQLVEIEIFSKEVIEISNVKEIFS